MTKKEIDRDGQDIVMGTDRRLYNVQCNNCNAWGHYSREYPRASSTVSNDSKNVSVPVSNPKSTGLSKLGVYDVVSLCRCIMN